MSLFNITSKIHLKNKLFVKVLLKTLDYKYIDVIFKFFHGKKIISLKENEISREYEKLLEHDILVEREDFIELDQDLEEALSHIFTEIDLSENKSYQLKKENTFDSLLKIIVAFTDYSKFESSFDLKSIIKLLELVDSNGNITSKGFEFLLMTKNEQLWYLLLNTLGFFDLEESEALNFLVSILSLKNNTKNQIKKDISVNFYNILEFLHSLGVVLIEKDCFYTNFSEIYQKPNNLTRNEGFMIIETNFKIYAYTSKVYEREILNLFSKITLDIPGMIRCSLDEEKVINALEKNITIDQLIKYIRTHVYNGTKIPENMVNQMRIWDGKRNRIKVYHGILYDNFDNYNSFMTLLQFSKNINALIYVNIEKKALFLKSDSKEKIREFLKTEKK
ncbi:hypothetical protein NUSPORA_00858 [Nucleospora cyclopteri]